jgi:chaperonin GroEL
MSKKQLIFGSDARRAIQDGVNEVVDAVQISYGPLGRTAVIEQKYGQPVVTNDGVTIAKAVELEGYEQLGVSLVQQAANKTNDQAGDGTSLTTVLCGALINEGIRVVEAGNEPVKVKAGIIKAKDFAIDYLVQNAKQIENETEMADVATISSRSREIGEMIARILKEVGKDGTVTVQNGDSNKIEKDVVQGMQFDKGYKSPYFVTDTTKMEAVIDKPKILITDKKISSIQEMVPLLESMLGQSRKDLVIIADDIEGDALANFVLNKVRGIVNVLAVQAPAFGDRRKEILKDIATLTGATLIADDLGMKIKDVTIDDLGSADKVIATKDTTTIIGGKGEEQAINDRIAKIRADIEATDSTYDKEKLQERLAKLTGGVGVIKVGASTEVEMKELKFVVEDALNATKAAVSQGVVAGGACTLLRIAKDLDQLTAKTTDEGELTGIKIVKNALQAPFRAIARNSGIYDIALLVDKILNSKNGGYDFKKGQEVDDMIASGIIDPVLVLKEALNNSVSVVSSIITTDVAIIEEKEENKAGAGAGAGMGDMGGMY